MLLKPLGCIPLLKPIAARSLHLGVRIALARRGILPHTELQRATFCTTPRRCATEDNKPNPYKTEFWQMIEQTMKERPELKQQFMELHQELKAAGIDVTSRPLSRQEMLALLFKPKIYELLLKMSASFQELGMDQKKMMDTLMKAVSDEEPPSQK